MNENFGDNPMDAFTVPVSRKTHKLAETFTMKSRANPEKPGRTLTVLWDAREPAIPGFVNLYSYLVRFTQLGGKAGNHYHKKKHELFFAVSGEFRVVLEDTDTKQREEFTLKAGDNTFLYVKPPLAHVVISKAEDSSLLVLASSPEVTTDEFVYTVVA